MRKTHIYIIIGAAILITFCFLLGITSNKGTNLTALAEEYERLQGQQLANDEKLLDIACEGIVIRMNECWHDRYSEWCEDLLIAVEGFEYSTELSFLYDCFYTKSNI